MRSSILALLPQRQLRLARFRGVDRNEFFDQRQFHEHAFNDRN